MPRISTYKLLMEHEEVLALKAAIDTGAFSRRADTLTTLVDANRGRQQADGYERELRMLERAVSTIRDMTPEGA